MTNQHKQYLRTQIQTASKEQLVLMLFDGAIRFCEQGKEAMAGNEIEPAHVALTRAQEVVMELLYAVDRDNGGALAENLVRLYSYALICLVEANMKRDADKVDEVQRIMRELREGWVGAMDQSKTNGQKDEAEPPAPPAPMASPDTVALSKDAPTPATPPAAAPKVAPRPPKRPPLSEMAASQPRLSVQG